MQKRALTILIYASAAVGLAAILSALSRHPEVSMLLFAVPLSFVFAFPRHLFAAPLPQRNQRIALALGTLGIGGAIFLFVRLALPFWENPLRYGGPPPLLAIPLVTLPIFAVAAFFLLLKRKSGLAILACVLLLPYWLWFALASLDPFFQVSGIRAALYFLCFLSPGIFAFAAGSVAYRSKAAHFIALTGLFAVPWIYSIVLRGYELTNPWIMFNASDREFHFDPQGLTNAKIMIVGVALMALGFATALLRLLPNWQLRGFPIGQRTWPAFIISFLALAVWFSKSVMPYRIPGAVDYADWPILQILHVEKRGLQFHERCISVFGRRFEPASLSFSGNDRRLFRYRFRQTHASGQLSQPLRQRVQAMLQAPEHTTMEGNLITPLRSWNADGWYLQIASVGVKAYTTENASTPPADVLSLFHDLEATPRSAETYSDRKDVCLGFCYDPLSGLGSLYSNHRCFNAGHGFDCR